MLGGCQKCKGIGALLFLLFGILFLLRDFNVWDFWDIQGWTVLFLLIGVITFAHKKCPDCQAMKK